jgi:hypothetical protein
MSPSASATDAVAVAKFKMGTDDTRCSSTLTDVGEGLGEVRITDDDKSPDGGAAQAAQAHKSDSAMKHCRIFELSSFII